MSPMCSVKLDTHLILAHGDEVVEVNAAAEELWAGMLGDQLGVQGRSDGELCSLCQQRGCQEVGMH